MALSDRDYVTRRKKKRSKAPGGGSRRAQTWMGVNRNFVLGALIVVIACVAVYVLRLMQS
jgi:hypothetical protein